MNKQKAIFLDRDGVLNRRIPGGYVQNYEQWEWLPGALSACAALADQFDRILIITNQQGIGKGIMSIEDLNHLHQKVTQDIEAAGGRVDGIYFCPHLKSDNCGCRKPRPGLIRQALNEFPDISIADSYLVGDSYSDLLLANRIRLKPVWVDTKEEDREVIQSHLRLKTLQIRHRIPQLAALPERLKSKSK